ncbi:hypothetical protein RB195_015564 [Necator americanus]|uniref:BHLH domain-containing protein n=1 Tax=Necator americanus TaxID=51031 RepID=A0ABR1E556_NECAM
MKESVELIKNSLEKLLATPTCYAPVADQDHAMPKEVAQEKTNSKDWTADTTSEHQDPVGRRNVGEEEVEEDSALYDEYECREQKEACGRTSTYTNERIRQKKERREQLDKRRDKIEEFLRYSRDVPENKSKICLLSVGMPKQRAFE